MNIVILSNVVGLIGVVICVAAYFLLSIKKLQSDRYLYPFLNVVASAFILFSIFVDWNLSAFFMELTWLVVSIICLIVNFRARRKKA